MSVIDPFTDLMNDIPGRYRNAIRDQREERERERLSLLDQMCEDPKPLYYIVKGSTERNLQDRVQELLERGWIIQGGIAYYKDGYGENFLQAMFKPAKPEEPENHLGDVEFRV